ncbi:MAG TPA: AMP-binding protein [Opitutaceae bacterium]|jgi:O-succinylbenzoic acid--CoA ligase|nr:AMP-binding protein [Opitutaceae bacterium]
MERSELAEALRAALGRDHAIAAQIGGRANVFLTDPNWGESERAQAAAWAGRAEAADREGWLMIPSGGTSGRLKFARHDQGTIAAAAAGFLAHFGAARVSAVGVLPLYHVSGLMAWMRCALSGGRYVEWDWKRLEAGELPAAPAGWKSLSLVPTQLQRLLALPPARDWLRGFDAVFVGGGPPWPALLDAAAEAQIPVSAGYGMTETAAMACGQLPSEFLAGDRSSGRPLPHVKFEVNSEGVATLAGESICRGYFGLHGGGGVVALKQGRCFATEDYARIDGSGRVHILGRRDAVIITGGKKVDPAEVEAALRAANLFSDLAVVGIPDREWGQAVALCYPATDAAPSESAIAEALAGLAAYKRPRRIVPFAPWPRTPQGKLNRALLAASAK